MLGRLYTRYLSLSLRKVASSFSENKNSSRKAVTTLGELEGLEEQLCLMTEADHLLVTKDGLVGSRKSRILLSLSNVHPGTLLFILWGKRSGANG